MRRRVHLVPFTVTIPYERRDKRLASKLLEERDGILAWMAEGCLEWQRIGLAPPKAVLDATEEYFQEEDAVGQFLQEECVPRKGAKTPVAEVFDRWRKRAEARGEHAATSRWLVRQLAARGFWATKGAKGAQVLEGLVLLVDSGTYNDA
jgi:putative DNA primase/helicase